MKILVCISHVPDTTTKIQFSGDGKSLNAAGVAFVINPNDEFGLSRAIGFQEEGKKVTITAICVGGKEVEPTLRKALAIGANDAVRINAAASEAAFVAKEIAEYAKDKGFDLIFTGKESIDYNGSMVPGMLAEMLQIPFVSFATKIDLTSDTTATVLREVDGGQEVLHTTLPAVVSCQKDVAKERIPNMRGIMSSRTKPLVVVEPSGNEGFVHTVSYDYPPAKGGCTYLKADTEVAKLAEMLHAKGFI